MGVGLVLFPDDLVESHDSFLSFDFNFEGFVKLLSVTKKGKESEIGHCNQPKACQTGRDKMVGEVEIPFFLFI